MDPSIYDNPQEQGIDLELDLENGLSIKLFLTDEAARDMITIIDNKLIARNK